MEKGETMFYAITLFSLIAFVYIAFGTVLKISDIADERFMSLTGNVVIDLEDNFKIGDDIHGDIILTEKDTNVYGIILLTKDGEPIITKTFNLKDISKSKIDSKKSLIKIEDLINYSFGEKGSYELFFSVLDLDVNIKKDFIVE